MSASAETVPVGQVFHTTEITYFMLALDGAFFFLVVDGAATKQFIHVCYAKDYVKLTAPQRGVFATALSRCSYFRIRLEDNRCPVCRQEIDNIEPVYIS